MKIIDREFNILGNKLSIRFEPKPFKDLMDKFKRLIANDNLKEAEDLFEEAYNTWGMDPELIRVNTLISFLKGD